MADIGKAWPVLIVCGGILPLFLSVIWLMMIRHFVAAMPWITVVLFNVLIHKRLGSLMAYFSISRVKYVSSYESIVVPM
jgi:uncharacterized membrane protein SirB2